MKPAAIRATFTSIRHVQGRKVYQLVMEVVDEQIDEALAILGGMPKSDDPIWCGIARMIKPTAGPETVPASPPRTPEAEPEAQEKAGKPKRRFSELPRSAQAGILCSDPRFIRWIGANDSIHAAEKVRSRCQVESRADLDRYKTFPDSAGKWDIIVTAFHAENSLMAELR